MLPTKKYPGSGILFLGLVDPSRNRKLRVPYFDTQGTCMGMHASIFFFKRGQIYMKDVESTESKEKSKFGFFRFLFFELWLFLVIFVKKNCKFSMNFHDSSKKNRENRKHLFFIQFITLRIFHESGIKTEGRGEGLHSISLVGAEPKRSPGIPDNQLAKGIF